MGLSRLGGAPITGWTVDLVSLATVRVRLAARHRAARAGTGDPAPNRRESAGADGGPGSSGDPDRSVGSTAGAAERTEPIRR